MLRVHSKRLLGAQLWSSPSVLSVVGAPHQPVWIRTHTDRKSSPWVRFAREDTAAAAPAGPDSASWAARRKQFGSSECRISAASFSFPARSVLSRRLATVGVDGGGSGSWSGNRGGGGGGGGGGRSGDGAGGGWSWRRIWAWYLGLLDTNPVLTKAVTSASLTFVGDVFCQYGLEKADNLDGKRTAVMTFLGFGLVGPTLHYWYATLNKLVTVGGPAGVGIRLILDQFVFSPIFIATFISSLLTLEGKSKQITAKLKQDWWSAVLFNWQLWIPAQVINFSLVPLKLQVAFANFIALFWNAYISYKSHVEVAVPQSLTEKGKT